MPMSFVFGLHAPSRKRNRSFSRYSAQVPLLMVFGGWKSGFWVEESLSDKKQRPPLLLPPARSTPEQDFSRYSADVKFKIETETQSNLAQKVQLKHGTMIMIAEMVEGGSIDERTWINPLLFIQLPDEIVSKPAEPDTTVGDGDTGGLKYVILDLRGCGLLSVPSKLLQKPESSVLLLADLHLISHEPDWRAIDEHFAKGMLEIQTFVAGLTKAFPDYFRP
mmetsp:Transcript_11849/g.21430  ORF Transcript_11849/g.21430 Transcript_11849/m.21430 type:complete len:221 (+) Transcript_11849:1653-2315(+)